MFPCCIFFFFVYIYWISCTYNGYIYWIYYIYVKYMLCIYHCQAIFYGYVIKGRFCQRSTAKNMASFRPLSFVILGIGTAFYEKKLFPKVTKRQNIIQHFFILVNTFYKN